MKIHFGTTSLLVLSMLADPAGASCIKDELTVAGSTTVYPVVVEWAYGYKETCTESNVTVDWELGGSSAGAKRVCGDPAYAPIEIGTLSRQMNSKEAVKQADGYSYNCLIGDTTRSVAEFKAFYDAVVLIVDNSSSVAECVKTLGCLTSDQIRWMFSNYTEAQLIATGWNSSALSNSDGSDETHLWSELHASCPAEEIAIAGTDTVGRLSGEAEYFQKTFFKGVEPLRKSYVSIIDHDAITQFVLDTPGAIAFNSYHAAHHAAELGLDTKFVPIKSPSGQCVTATKETVQSLTYLPLGRLTYMYVLKSNCTALKDGLSYIEYAYSPEGQLDIEHTYGVPLTDADIAAGSSEIAALYAGCASLFL